MAAVALTQKSKPVSFPRDETMANRNFRFPVDSADVDRLESREFEAFTAEIIQRMRYKLSRRLLVADDRVDCECEAMDGKGVLLSFRRRSRWIDVTEVEEFWNQIGHSQAGLGVIVATGYLRRRCRKKGERTYKNRTNYRSGR